MQTQVFFIVVIAFIISLVYFGVISVDVDWLLDFQQAAVYQNQDNQSEKSQEDQNDQEKAVEKPTASNNTSQSYQAPKTTSPAPSPSPALSPSLLETYITKGPKDNEAVEDGNEVTFEFKGKMLSGNIQEKIYFETKVVGLDKDWVRTSQNQRKIIFPSGNHIYTFWVRAKSANFIDSTPASRIFTVNISPYFKKIRISTIAFSSSYRPSLITLTTALTRDERINVTGWYLEGKGGKVVLPKAVERYYHYYNSPGSQDIILEYSNRIYLSSGFNPLGYDKNFRTNKCLGYLKSSFSFPLTFASNCPKPTQEDISHLDPCCQEFIRYLRPCQIPDYSDRPKIYGDSECISYINQNLNNVGCFNNYFNDKDFLGNDWHIYLNGKDILVGNDCDVIYLRDKNGLLVDKYSYGSPVCR